MASDIGLELNLSGGGDGAFGAAFGIGGERKVHRKSWRAKKERRGQQQQGGGGAFGASQRSGGGARGRKATSAHEEPAAAAAGGALKGYELSEAPAHPRDGSRTASTSAAAPQHAGTNGWKHEQAGGGPPAQLRSGGGAPGRQRAGMREREATPDSDAMVGGSDDDDEGREVLGAVAAALQREAALKQQLRDQGGASGGGSDGDSDAVVDFSDDEVRVAGGYGGLGGWHGVPQPAGAKKRKRAAQKARGGRDGTAGVAVPAAGSLAHAETRFTDAARAQIFGDAAAAGGGGGGGDEGGGGGGGFEALGVSAALASHLAECKYSAPTKVQQAAIPVLLAGRDAMVNAPTGSGKTLAYLAPAVQRMAALSPRWQRGDGCAALVVAPTRELVLQIHDTLQLLLRRYHWLVGGALLGGENRNHEKRRLRKGCGLLVATPGRLLDHLTSTAAFQTGALRLLVLDEADRLLDMGFEAKIGEIVSILDARLVAAGTPRRQTVLLSATLHGRLGALAGLALEDPVAVGLPPTAALGGGAAGTGGGGGAQERFVIPSQLKQRFMEVPCKLRLVALAAVLKARSGRAGGGGGKVVVFLSSCDGVEFAHRMLGEVYDTLFDEPLLECPLFKLHGLMAQGERTATFVDFSKARGGALLCTDVAARGLDFPSVSTIVQYDPPGEPSEYVHRIGRTARMGARGEALLFLQPHERGYLQALEGVGCGLAEEPLAPLLDWLLPAGFQGQARKGRTLESHEGAYSLSRALAGAVERQPPLASLAGDAFRSYVRAYAAHPAAVKAHFHPRALHLGHVAHSFALRERPTMVGASATKQHLRAKKEDAAKARARKGKRAVRRGAGMAE